MTAILLDAGALIALDRDERPMWRRFENARRDGTEMVTHAGIVGQVWRHPARQAGLARALRAVHVVPLDLALARAAGELSARVGTSDVHDAALALLCSHGDTLVTGDIEDLGRLLDERRLESVAMVRP